MRRRDAVVAAPPARLVVDALQALDGLDARDELGAVQVLVEGDALGRERVEGREDPVERQEPVLREVVPRAVELELARQQGRQQVLEVELVLRRRRVEARDDGPPQRLVGRPRRPVDAGHPGVVGQELGLDGGPGRRLEPPHERRAPGRVREEPGRRRHVHVRRDGADVAAGQHERVVEDQHVLRLEARRGPEGEARPRDAVREAHEDVRRPRLVDRREVGAAAVARRERVGADLAAVPALLDAVVALRLGPGVRGDEVVDGALEGGLGDAAAGLPHASQGLLDARERAPALREGFG